MWLRTLSAQIGTVLIELHLISILRKGQPLMLPLHAESNFGFIKPLLFGYDNSMTDSLKTEPVTMEWLMEDTIEKGSEISLAKMTVATNEVSELHSHSNCTETIHVLRGTIEQRRGNEWVKLGQGETCLIPKGYKHQTRNIGSERAVLMLAFSSGSRLYET